jgi:hypothetical protein
MSTTRHKTLRRTSAHQDISSNALDFSVNSSLAALLSNEATSAYRKPWHRLERGLRMNRLRQFADDLAVQRSLKPAEKEGLLALLTRALDRKLLNSKTAVLYDVEQEKITEIKSLVMHQKATGEVLFQLMEKRNAVTFRKRPGAGGGSAAPLSAAAGQAEEGVPQP